MKYGILAALLIALFGFGCVGTPPENQQTSMDPLSMDSEMGIMPMMRFNVDSPEAQQMMQDLEISADDQAFIKDRLEQIRTMVHDQMGDDPHLDWKSLILADTLDTDAIKAQFQAKMDRMPDLLQQVLPTLMEIVNHFPQEKRQMMMDKMEAKFQDQATQRQNRMDQMKTKMQRIFAGLNLSDEQTQTLNTLIDSFHAQLQSFHENADTTLHTQLKAAFISGELPVSDALALWQSHRDQITARMDTLLGFVQQFHAVFTPEQRSALVDKMQKRFDGMMNGKGMDHGGMFRKMFHGN